MRTILLLILAVLPEIFPDYKEVTIPEGIAPLNFSIQEKGIFYSAKFSCGEYSFLVWSLNGNINIPKRKWKNLLQGGMEITVETQVLVGWKWNCHKPFKIYVSSDSIDGYVAYRLLPPGGSAWGFMGIYQRNLASYEQTAIAENDVTDDNCMNCHSYPNKRADKFILPVRGKHSGIYLFENSTVEKLDIKMSYPQMNEDERYIAFSKNDTRRFIHSNDANRMQALDFSSDVFVYDIGKQSVISSPLTTSPDRFETFPCFSPDGRYVYFCSAKAVTELLEKYKEIKYNIMRIDFNPDKGCFGNKLEIIYDAASENKSTSMPRISPDGQFLMFNCQEYGNFPIYHKDANLYMVNLSDYSVLPLTKFNSLDAESYHSWSSNGRWVAFSSRRDDGMFTKLYIGHIDAHGNASKPFLLPQKNPKEFYLRFMYSYNAPEFVNGKIRMNPKKFAKSIIGNSKN